MGEMADLAICAIDGCDKPVVRRVWCNAHYMRWKRHGDPIGGGTSLGDPQRYFRQVVMAYDGDDCLIWPFKRKGDGYGRLWRDGRMQVVSRLVCEENRGPPPAQKHDAAHSCGNGHNGCVTKRHLSWKTRAGNVADMVLHGNSMRGARNWNTKLTEEQVLEIRGLRGKATQVDLAKRFGVARQSISAIHKGLHWGWL